MLSIIFCSRDPEQLARVVDNIGQTVGVEYEIVAVDNAAGQYGICEAYNAGAARSRFGTLCFVHEDVVFHTDGWGQRVADALRDPAVGLISVVGGTYQTKAPAGYWIQDFRTNRIYQNQRELDGSLGFQHFNPYDEVSSEVVAVDGLWMCCRRETWEQTPFDATTFPGFHLYDLDFSFSVRQQGLSVRVVYDVKIEHLSYGSYNRAWVESQWAFQKKWGAQLPASTEPEPLSRRERRLAEFVSTWTFVQILRRCGYPRSVVRRYACRCVLLRPFDRRSLSAARQVLIGPRMDDLIMRWLRS